MPSVLKVNLISWDIRAPKKLPKSAWKIEIEVTKLFFTLGVSAVKGSVEVYSLSKGTSSPRGAQWTTSWDKISDSVAEAPFLLNNPDKIIFILPWTSKIGQRIPTILMMHSQCNVLCQEEIGKISPPTNFGIGEAYIQHMWTCHFPFLACQISDSPTLSRHSQYPSTSNSI